MPPAPKAAEPKKRPQTTAPGAEGTTAKKRKVNWATIDDEGTFEGFEVRIVKPGQARKSKGDSPAPKKQKTGKAGSAETDPYKDAPLDAQSVQKNPFEAGPLGDAHYKVKPEREWESTQRYRKFTSKSSPVPPLL